MIEAVIKKDLGSFKLDVAFTAGDEILALLGGSGCGKSLTLRAIAGIITPDSGYIAVNGRVFFDSEHGINLPPQKRHVGLLFQNYALFPTMTVLQNIMTGVRTGTRAQRRAAAEEAAERFQLQGLEDRLPSELSGGQQQRAALARIMVGRPELLMLDEPFSALDSHLRDRMEREVTAVLRDFGGTTLLVSHSRDEVFRMADSIAVYNAGQIDAIGEKHELFRDPGTLTAAMLTGCKNFSAVSHLRHENGRTVFTADDWGMELSVRGEKTGDIAGLRRHYAELADAPGENTYQMEVVSVLEDPFEYVVFLRRPGFDGKPFEWAVTKKEYAALPKGRLLLRFPDEALMLLEE